MGLALAAFIGSLGGLQFGFAIGVLNVPQALIAADLGVAADGLAWSTVVSVFCLGGLLGAQAAGAIADSRGRRGLLAVSAAACAVAGVLQFAGGVAAEAGMPEWALAALALGRLGVGVGSGLATVGVPLYLGEIAPRSRRGLFGSLNQLAVVIGILLSQVVAAATLGMMHWRYLLLIPTGVGAVQLVCGMTSALPETPNWFISKRSAASDALSSLRRLRPPGEEGVSEEYDAILADVREAAEQSVEDMRLVSMLADKTLRLQLFVAASMMIGQQWSGINAIFYYSTGFFADAGLSDPVVGTLLASSVNALAMAATVPFMETAGRRRLLLLGIGGMLIAALTLTLVLLVKEIGGVSERVHHQLNMASVACVLFFVAAFELGPGPIPWQIGSEIFSDAPRATAMGAAAVLNWVCNGLIGLAFPPMQAALGPTVFLPFCAVLAAWLLITLKYVPETKGRSIAQIQLDFAGLAGGDMAKMMRSVV